MLYSEYDVDRLEREIKQAQKSKIPDYYVGSFLPNKSHMEALFKRCRNYQSEVSDVKKDVTFSEKEAEIMNNLDDYTNMRAANKALFDSVVDEDVTLKAT